MKTSAEVEARIATLQARRDKLQRALDNMDGRLVDASILLHKTEEREKPQSLVKHIESVGEFASWFSGLWYHVTIEVDGETLTYGTSRRPRVLNARTRVEGEITYDDDNKPTLKVAPRVEGGKIWVKEYFIDQMKENEREKAKKSQEVA